jgi:hypothetical protein
LTRLDGLAAFSPFDEILQFDFDPVTVTPKVLSAYPLDPPFVNSIRTGDTSGANAAILRNNFCGLVAQARINNRSAAASAAGLDQKFGRG